MRKRLTRIGNGYGLILPRHLLEAAGISPTEAVTISANPGEIRIIASSRSDEALINAYLKVEKKHGRLLRRLAR